MHILLDGSGAVVCFGAAGLTAQAGQTLQDTTLTLADFAVADKAGGASGSPYDVTYDGKAFGYRTRQPSAAELDAADRADLQQKMQSALDNWATLTTAQKDALLRVCVRAALRALKAL